ncbi:MBL fold metallo-hydrolase [Chelativorans sp. AA-79]|uniref:MBL fold metallo-hydrolase n=1 Tax=Chelativorans sp. AA-79 TaxID=3028735 RepID=UPI0023F7C411|nr:MBL fold metallo-hydrolase [Chelativorans sp. AA-79]WEX11751.1 MBL fold metallo-hydrolase [Chelativorans sp. AA-79]
MVEIRPDLAYRRLMMVNVVFYGFPGARDWVLIDSGIAGSAGAIREAAGMRFGEGNPPSSIVLTHGHFDHVGALEVLAEEWDVPVYAHPLEHPYLDGRRSYPPADPWVGGGSMALLSPLFPTRPIDVGARLQALPDDGTVPGMPEWCWMHTPGHSPGHVSLWREEDSSIIIGDAVVTTGQESAYEIAAQSPQMHGPPRYFTPDWQEAWASVRKLAALEPELIVTGHGHPMQGAEMRRALHKLADEFDSTAFPVDMRAM